MATSLGSALAPATRMPERAVIRPRAKVGTVEADAEDEPKAAREPRVESTSSTKLPRRDRTLHDRQRWQARRPQGRPVAVGVAVVAVVVLAVVGVLIAVYYQGATPQRPEPNPPGPYTPQGPIVRGPGGPTNQGTPPPPAPAVLPVLAVAYPGVFTPLFNGRDLDDWIVVSTRVGGGAWKVADGTIVSEGGFSLLGHKNTTFDDFHLRVEAMIERGDSGVFVRCERDNIDETGVPPSYEVQVTPITAQGFTTGSLARQGPHRSFPPASLDVPNRRATPAGEWFSLEVIALGPRIVVALNGRVTADVVDMEDGPARGRIALQQSGPDTRVRFRKVEVKEIRSPPLERTSDGCTPIFNGRDLSGWSPLPLPSSHATWTVEDGAIVCRGSGSVLASHRASGDFYLRTRAVLEQGHSGLMVRYGSTTNNGMTERAAYEAHIWPGQEVGRLIQFPPTRSHTRQRTAPPLVPGRWFDLELIAEGPRVQVRVDGVTTADVTDPLTSRRRGVIALHAAGSTLVRFQRIEVMELAPSPATAAADEFKPLFNGRDLTGWKHIPHFTGDWWADPNSGVMTVRAGGRMGGLFADATDYTDYHLYCEFRGELRFEGRSPLNVGDTIGFHAYAPSGVVVNHRTKTQSNPRRAAYPPSRDGWDRFELIVKGAQVTAYTNGEERGSFIDLDPVSQSKGGLLLGTLTYPTGRVPGNIEIRRLSIKRLR
jgi:hypothetical protein